MRAKPLHPLGFIVATLAGTVGLVGIAAQQPNQLAIAQPTPAVNSPSGKPQITNDSAVMALAKHLKNIGAKMYGAYWCPYCTRQKDLFGEAAFRQIDYVECDPRGENPRPNLCREAKIKGYPTWEIQGKLYVGVQSLEDLAKASDYKGVQRF